MKNSIKKHMALVLHHLYINPLERCNLRCKICYTRKTDPILSKSQILEFVSKYQKKQIVESITFCGGEVFTLPYFCEIVNILTEKNIFIQIITNGTIDHLDKLKNENLINIIVSIDGLRPYHDLNRGTGNFDKSIAFLKKTNVRGFHTEIFSIVTRQNYQEIDAFETTMQSILNPHITITFHPRKPPAYLLHHPLSNVIGVTENFDFLTTVELIDVMKRKKTFPPKNLGCFQIAVASSGNVYGCCEGTLPLGTIYDDVAVLVDRMKDKLELWEKTTQLKHCLGCSAPDFVCGIKPLLVALDA